MSVVNSMYNIQLPFSISGSSPIESQLFRAYGTLTTAAWRYFHSKKRTPSSRIPQMDTHQEDEVPNSALPLLIAGLHRPLCPILRLSVRTNTLPFNGGTPVCLTYSFLFSYRLLAGDIFSVALLSLTNRKLSAMRRYSEKHCPVLRI